MSEIDDEDARSRYLEEEADNNVAQASRGSISSGTDDRTIVAFEPNDPGNPYNWSTASQLPISVVEIHVHCELTGSSEKESFHCIRYYDDRYQLDYGQRSSQRCYSIYHQGMEDYFSNSGGPTYRHISCWYVMEIICVVLQCSRTRLTEHSL